MGVIDSYGQLDPQESCPAVERTLKKIKETDDLLDISEIMNLSHMYLKQIEDRKSICGL